MFENLDDDDVKYIEDYTRNKIPNLISLNEKEPGSFTEEQKVMFFGLYASNPKEFEYTRGEQKLIAAITKNIKETLYAAENREDGLEFFNNPVKGNWWKNLESTSLGFLYNDTRVFHSNRFPKTKSGENTAQNDIQHLKKSLFNKAEKITITYKLKNLQQLRDFTENSIFVRIVEGYSIKGEIECNFCEENSKRVKVYYHNSSNGYWVIANFEKHFLRQHMNGISKPNSRSKPNQNYSISDDEYTFDESKSDGDKAQSSRRTVSLKIEPAMNEFNGIEDNLYTQISKQNIQIINASLSNSEEVIDFYSRVDLESKKNTRTIKMCKIIGDGSCLYGSLAHQIYYSKIGSLNHQLQTKKMREMCVNHILTNLDEFKPYLKGRIYDKCEEKNINTKSINFDDENDENVYTKFVDTLKLHETFGGIESMKVISDIFKVNIVTINRDGSCHLALRLNIAFDRTIFIAYSNKNHYDSIVEIDALTIGTYAKKLVEDEMGLLTMATNLTKIH